MWASIIIIVVVICLAIATLARAATTTFYGSPFTVWGLDSGQTLARQDVPGEGCCSADLSLISDNTQPDSFAYPFVVTLNDTTSPLATQESSQTTGVNVRSYSSSTGSPWLAGVHSEVWHGWSYPTLQQSPANGVTLAYNAEVHRSSAAGTVIGMNVSDLGPLPADDAINIQGQWKMGIQLGENDLEARNLTASSVSVASAKATSVNAATINSLTIGTGSINAIAVSAQNVQAKRFMLAPGVWLDYEGGRIVLRRGGRIVARF